MDVFRGHYSASHREYDQRELLQNKRLVGYVWIVSRPCRKAVVSFSGADQKSSGECHPVSSRPLCQQKE